MKQKLQVEHLHELSDVLLSLSQVRAEMGTFTTVHALVCAEIKIKADKVLASGQIASSGVKITLSPAQYHVCKFINERGLFSHNAVFCNAVVRLLVLNLTP